MRPRDTVQCRTFPCTDINTAAYQVPAIDLDPEYVRIMMISEAAPPAPSDFYYAPGNPLFAQTTVQAFQDAGAGVSSLNEILDAGIYLTTAVKCGKVDYRISAQTIKECSCLLEREIELFAGVRVYLLMGDVAITSLNAIARRNGLKRVIPAGSTYKIRGGDYAYRGVPAIPSYLQAGPAFFIEKSKRQMIAEDIRRALDIAGISL